MALPAHPRVRERLERRHRGIEPAVIDVAWRAQQRLYKRHSDMAARRKPPGGTNIAIARELAYFLWEAATL